MQRIAIYVQCDIIQLEGVDFYGNHKYQHSDGFRVKITGRGPVLGAGHEPFHCIHVFVRQSLRDGGIPFEIKMDQPNKETMAAMLEAERIAKDPNVKGYTDLDELFADLKK